MDRTKLNAALVAGSEMIFEKSELGRLFQQIGYDCDEKGHPEWRNSMVLADASRPDAVGNLGRVKEKGLSKKFFEGNWRAFRPCILQACRLAPVVEEIAQLGTPAADMAVKCWIYSFMANADEEKTLDEIDKIVPGFREFEFRNFDSLPGKEINTISGNLSEKVAALLKLSEAESIIENMEGDWRPILHGVSIQPEGDGFLLSESLDFDSGFADTKIAVLDRIAEDAVIEAIESEHESLRM